MRILLTGAGGFVGGQLLQLMKKRGYFVKALSRSDRSQMAVADEVLVENLSRQSDFAALLQGVDTLVHLADGFNAYEHLPAGVKNEQASKRLQTLFALAEQAAENGVAFIYLSTIKTMCGHYSPEILSETSKANPQSLYGQLKLEAEQGILRLANRYGSRAVILRFPIVFGAGVGGNMQKLLVLADSPIPLPFAGMDNQRSLISAQSLFEAVMVIVENQQVQTGMFLVQDGAVSSADLVRSLRQGLGRPAHLFTLAQPFCSLMEKMPFVGAGLLRFTRSLAIDDSQFRSTYNWHPTKPLDELLLAFAAFEKNKKHPSSRDKI